MFLFKKRIALAFACMVQLSINAQNNFVYADIDEQFKLAKEYFIHQQYSLAFPVFKTMHLQQLQQTAYPNHLTKEVEYYYLLCGLQLLDHSVEEKAIAFVNTQQQNAKQQKMAYHLANYYFKQKNYTDAITYYNKAAINNLTNTEISTLTFNKAYCLFTQQKLAEAKPLFNAIKQLKTDVNYVDANYYYGFIAFADKEYAAALESFLIAEKEPAYNNLVPFYIAEIYYYTNQRDKALQYSLQQLQNNNQFYKADLEHLIGVLYFDKRQFAQALPYFEQYAAANDKITREDMYQLSYCYYEAGNWYKSINGFKQLGGKEDSLAQNSMYLLADAYLKTNQKANARNAFLFCASNNSNPIQQEISAFSYAKLSYELGYTDVALKELQNYILSYPNSKNQQEAKELLVAVLSNTSNYKAALVLFESLKTQSEQVKKIYPSILYGRSVELLNDQQIVAADSLLAKIEFLPYNNSLMPYVYFWRGEIAYRLGNIDNAIVYIENYLLNSVTNSEVNTTNAKYTAGYSYLKKGNYNKAKQYFNSIAPLINTSSAALQQDAYARLADCYFMTKEYKKANELYEELVNINNKGADYALYQIAIIQGATNKQEKKVTTLQQLIQQYPQSNLLADAYIEIANSYLAEEQFTQAITPLQQVLNNKEASALYPQPYLKLGISYFNTNDNNNALTNFTTLVKQYPNAQESDEAVEYIRNIFIENQQPDGFVNFMQSNGKKVSVDEADSLTFKSAFIRYNAKDFTAAAMGFENYLNTYPTGKYNIEANYFMAEILIANKQNSKALPYYIAVSTKAPNKYAERSTLQAARILYFDEKNYTLAQQYYTQLKTIVTQQESRLEAMRGLLRCQYKLQQYKVGASNAQELLLEKGAATDDKMMANMMIAQTNIADSNWVEATAAFKRVVLLGKSEYAAEAQYNMAAILLWQKKYADAEKAAFEVIKQYASYEFWVTKSYILLGDVYAAQKDYFNAEATYKSVAENSTIAALQQLAANKLQVLVAEKNKANNIIVTP